ncbi:MAG TPA: 4Fe-4S binding protein [Armatimonadota bacterium]|nr:4Fe-4S binding protein [Armatimonadota bacterium]
MTDKTASRAFIVVRTDRCKSCGWCVDHCPKDNLRISTETNAQGYHPSEVVDMDDCTGCAQCALVCPDMCITVYRAKREE